MKETWAHDRIAGLARRARVILRSASRAATRDTEPSSQPAIGSVSHVSTTSRSWMAPFRARWTDTGVHGSGPGSGAGLEAVARAGGVARRKPDDPGEGRTGQEALLRPPPLGHRHRVVQQLPQRDGRRRRRAAVVDGRPWSDRAPQRSDGLERRVPGRAVLGWPGAEPGRAGQGTDRRRPGDGDALARRRDRARPGHPRLRAGVPASLRGRPARHHRQRRQSDRGVRAHAGHAGQPVRPLCAGGFFGPRPGPEGRPGAVPRGRLCLVPLRPGLQRTAVEPVRRPRLLPEVPGVHR